MRHPHHGGQNARDWRRRIAALANRQRENVFSYKFGLKAEEGDFDFDAAARAYDIAEGVGRGSLIGLLCAVHLSGFRLFSKEAEARRFRDRARYPAADFARALRDHAGIDNARVTIQSIEETFATPPRSKGGEPPSWSAEDVARRLFQAWNGRSPGERDRDGAEFALADGIAREIAGRFVGWRELAADTPGALAQADGHLERLDAGFPRLGALPPPSDDVRPANCTFARDPESPFVDMEDNKDIWPHQVVSVCAARLRRDGCSDPSSSDFGKALANGIVTRSNNGMSWLFSNGLRYLQGADEETIAEDLSVPATELRRVRQLKAFADAIPPKNPLFDRDGYAEFRGSVGGKVSSWVSNYWKRLGELDGIHADPPDIRIPEALRERENAPLFSGQHTDAEGLEALAGQLAERVERASAALAVLRGEDDVPGRGHVADVERVQGYVAGLAGQIGILKNRLDQEIERAEDAARDERLKALKKEFDDAKLKEPSKLNKISGGTDDAIGETERLEREFNAAVRARRERFRILAEAAGADGALDPLPAMAELERRVSIDRGDDPSRADEQALRRLLHRIVGMSRRLSPATAGRVRNAMTPVFAKGKDANRCFHNRQGALYRHPFSTSRHEPYELSLERARGIDWLARLESLAEEIRRESNRSGAANPATARDLLVLEGFVFLQRLRGLPDRVPGEAARLGAGEGAPDVPPLLAAQLEGDEVSRDIALRAFNLFESEINGLAFRVFRDDFTVRVRFQRLDRDELFYAPKDRAWRPPDEYAAARSAISAGLALPAVARDEAGKVLPRETAAGLSKAKFPEPGSRALLRQAPHDWFVELDFRHGEAPRLSGLPLKKNRDGLKRWRAAKRPAFRLVGPPSFETWLGRALTRADVKLGDYTLILDRVFEQSARWDGEEIRLSAKPARLNASLTVPAVDGRPRSDAAPEMLFDNIVAIDLGEKRIGFAAFSLASLLEDGVLDPVETGTVAVPAFRRLMAAVSRHRGSRQPGQKVGQTHSRALMRFRENVVGDVCNRIETLCERFRAFPVLESSVGNFESGARQLSMIYGSVLRRYVFSPVEAHKTRRRRHWFTADTWTHPWLFDRRWNEGERRRSGPSESLRIFPGVAVNPAGTSQTCHRCGRNALAAMRAMPDGDRVEVGDDGRIVLGDGAIRLLERSVHSPGDAKRFRRDKQRSPLNEPPRRGRRKRRDVERILRRNMRQAPRSEMSPDTTQARFVCVYEDCSYEGQADENAAVNIGRRFLLERIDIERSREARKKAMRRP